MRRLEDEHRLSKEIFVEQFKIDYKNDYEGLVEEFDLTQREFRKNRRGNPKKKPIRPEITLMNIYNHYFFKNYVKPEAEKRKADSKAMHILKTDAGKLGYKIKGKYKLVDSSTGHVVLNATTEEAVKRFIKSRSKEK